MSDTPKALIDVLLDGLPEGTTHITESKAHWRRGYYCIVFDAVKFVDGVPMVHEYDSDGEYPQWKPADRVFVKMPKFIELVKESKPT